MRSSAMAERIRIAVLDDEPLHARTAQSVLIELGYDARVATSLADFSALVDVFTPQIILLDVKMPEISGDVLSRKLKKDVSTKGTPILLYSSLSVKELEKRVERAGADGYVQKGLGPDELRDRLAELIEQMVF